MGRLTVPSGRSYTLKWGAAFADSILRRAHRRTTFPRPCAIRIISFSNLQRAQKQPPSSAKIMELGSPVRPDDLARAMSEVLGWPVQCFPVSCAREEAGRLGGFRFFCRFAPLLSDASSGCHKLNCLTLRFGPTYEQSEHIAVSKDVVWL